MEFLWDLFTLGQKSRHSILVLASAFSWFRSFLAKTVGVEQVQSYLDCEHPQQVQFANCVSCSYSSDFVYKQREELLASGALVPWVSVRRPCIVNGLGVVKNHKGKQRLILDCRYLNLFLLTSISSMSNCLMQ